MSNPAWQVGMPVWFRVDQRWYEGTIESFDTSVAIVKAQDEHRLECSLLLAEKESILPQNPSANHTVSDLTLLSWMNEPHIVSHLVQRYHRGVFYTNCSHILIAINPPQGIPDTYGSLLMEQFRDKKPHQCIPHVYTVAETAHRQLFINNRSQTIVISGSNGSGKSTTTSHILNYLSKRSAEGKDYGQLIEAATPILEAFGNATTRHNNNSSRFGKFLRLYYDRCSAQITGATVDTYLLEKTRVVSVPSGERSFHIFYQLLSCNDADMRAQCQLTSVAHFNLLSHTGDDSKDAVRFAELRRSFELLGINRSKQSIVFSVVAAVLHLGNLTFDNDGQQRCFVTNQAALENAAVLLDVKDTLIVEALTTRTVEGITTHLTKQQAAQSRDSLAMFIYGRLFDLIVRHINEAIHFDLAESQQCIGILDIFGFERSEKNGFEQFCINYCDERLQDQFNQCVFASEQEEHRREGIAWARVAYANNSKLIEQLEQPRTGIFSMLDVATTTGGGDEMFSQDMGGEKEFQLSHYAGNVTYSIQGFTERNRDFVTETHMHLLEQSDRLKMDLLSNELSFTNSSSSDSLGSSVSNARFIPARRTTGTGSGHLTRYSPAAAAAASARIEAPVTAEPKRKGLRLASVLTPSVISQFKRSLEYVMSIIRSTDTHFIRCIKPNDNKTSIKIDESIVQEQLRYSGLLEAIRICSLGYPTRMDRCAFLQRYRVCTKTRTTNDADAAKAIMQSAGIETSLYAIGETKVFLRNGCISILETVRAQKRIDAAIVIQKQFRRYVQRKRYVQSRLAIMIQSCYRHQLASNRFKCHLIATNCQRYVRRWLARRQLLSLRYERIKAVIREQHDQQVRAEEQRHTQKEIDDWRQQCQTECLAKEDALERLRLLSEQECHLQLKEAEDQNLHLERQLEGQTQANVKKAIQMRDTQQTLDVLRESYNKTHHDLVETQRRLELQEKECQEYKRNSEQMESILRVAYAFEVDLERRHALKIRGSVLSNQYHTVLPEIVSHSLRCEQLYAHFYDNRISFAAIIIVRMLRYHGLAKDAVRVCHQCFLQSIGSTVKSSAHALSTLCFVFPWLCVNCDLNDSELAAFVHVFNQLVYSFVSFACLALRTHLAAAVLPRPSLSSNSFLSSFSMIASTLADMQCTTQVQALIYSILFDHLDVYLANEQLNRQVMTADDGFDISRLVAKTSTQLSRTINQSTNSGIEVCNIFPRTAQIATVLCLNNKKVLCASKERLQVASMLSRPQLLRLLNRYVLDTEMGETLEPIQCVKDALGSPLSEAVASSSASAALESLVMFSTPRETLGCERILQEMCLSVTQTLSIMVVSAVPIPNAISDLYGAAANL